MKKLFLFTLLISSLLIVGCGNNVSDPTNDGGTVVESPYKANGISSVYEGKGYKFFSMDGNTYQITIKDGGISGLGTYSFDKSSIYSKNADGDTSIDGKYNVYVIYNNDYQGLIMFPKDNTIAGNILLKKVSDNTKTEGLIDIDRADRNIPQDYIGTWERTANTDPSKKLNLNIDNTFVLLTLNTGTSSTEREKIPSSFFINNNGIPTALGLFYGGTTMTINNEDSTLLLSLYDYSVTWNITIENGYITSYHVSTFEGHASYGGFTKK